MLIKTIDLICISEGAKALKQKTVLFKNNMLYGLDNINGYLIYTSIYFCRLLSNYVTISNLLHKKTPRT